MWKIPSCMRDTLIMADGGKECRRVLHAHGVRCKQAELVWFPRISRATMVRKSLRMKTHANASILTLSGTSAKIPAAGSFCQVQCTSKRNHAGHGAQHTAPWQEPRPAAAQSWHPLAKIQRQPVQSGGITIWAVIGYGYGLWQRLR